MKKDSFGTLLCVGFIGLVAMIGLLGRVEADTGHEGATRKEVGSYVDPSKITGSSVAGTAIFSATVKRPDGTAFNNTGSTVWIGSVTETLNGQVHTNILNGFPVLSSATFPLDGSMTGVLYVTCDAGVSTCEMRVIEGKVR